MHISASMLLVHVFLISLSCPRLQPKASSTASEPSYIIWSTLMLPTLNFFKEFLIPCHTESLSNCFMCGSHLKVP